MDSGLVGALDSQRNFQSQTTHSIKLRSVHTLLSIFQKLVRHSGKTHNPKGDQTTFQNNFCKHLLILEQNWPPNEVSVRPDFVVVEKKSRIRL